MTPPSHWVHDLSPFLIQITDTIGIRYYGLAYVLGFVVAGWLMHRFAVAGRSRLPSAQIADFMMAIIIGVLAGGRLGFFLLYQPQALLSDPLALLRVWDGGMASHGGFAGVVFAIWWYGRRHSIPFHHLGDLVAASGPAGLFFGRLANFINGELWGKTSTVPWAVIFPESASPGTPLILIEPRHPSQLYEAALEGLLLLAIMQLRFWRSDVTTRHPGRLAGECLLLYSVLRAIGEMFREPDAGLILGLSRGTFYSLFLIGGGLWLWLRPARPLSPAQ